MAASSSSSGAAATTYAVWLFDANFNHIVLVDVPVPLPNLLLYQGQYYVWSNVHWGYQLTTAYSPLVDLGAPQLSVLANPQQ